MPRSQWLNRVRRLELRREILDFQMGDLLSQRKGKVESLWDSSREDVGVTPQGVAQEDLNRLVEEDPGEDRLDKEPQLLEGLQSRGDPCIHFIRGVARDTLEIAPLCRKMLYL